jgi:hypothetical protein
MNALHRAASCASNVRDFKPLTVTAQSVRVDIAARHPRGVQSLVMNHVSVREEKASNLSHGLGVVPCMADLAMLVGFAARGGGARHVACVGVRLCCVLPAA